MLNTKHLRVIKNCGCDTYYAVDKSFKKQWTKYRSYEDIIKEVNQRCNKKSIK